MRLRQAVGRWSMRLQTLAEKRCSPAHHAARLAEEPMSGQSSFFSGRGGGADG